MKKLLSEQARLGHSMMTKKAAKSARLGQACGYAEGGLVQDAASALRNRAKVIDAATGAPPAPTLAPAPAAPVAAPAKPITSADAEAKAARFKWERENPGVPYVPPKFAFGGNVFGDETPGVYKPLPAIAADPSAGLGSTAKQLADNEQYKADLNTSIANRLGTGSPVVSAVAPVPATPAAQTNAATADPTKPLMPKTGTPSSQGWNYKNGRIAMKRGGQPWFPGQEIGSYAHGGLPAKVMPGGGPVTGPGGPKDDKVPAMLSNGEYVLTQKTKEALGGKEHLDALTTQVEGRPPVNAGVTDPVDRHPKGVALPPQFNDTVGYFARGGSYVNPRFGDARHMSVPNKGDGGYATPEINPSGAARMQSGGTPPQQFELFGDPAPGRPLTQLEQTQLSFGTQPRQAVDPLRTAGNAVADAQAATKAAKAAKTVAPVVEQGALGKALPYVGTALAVAPAVPTLMNDKATPDEKGSALGHALTGAGAFGTGYAAGTAAAAPFLAGHPLARAGLPLAGILGGAGAALGADKLLDRYEQSKRPAGSNDSSVSFAPGSDVPILDVAKFRGGREGPPMATKGKVDTTIGPPAPTLGAPTWSPYSDKQREFFAKNGVTPALMNRGAVDDPGAYIRGQTGKTMDRTQYQNLGDYGVAGQTIFGRASTPGGKVNDFVGAGGGNNAATRDLPSGVTFGFRPGEVDAYRAQQAMANSIGDAPTYSAPGMTKEHTSAMSTLNGLTQRLARDGQYMSRPERNGLLAAIEAAKANVAPHELAHRTATEQANAAYHGQVQNYNSRLGYAAQMQGHQMTAANQAAQIAMQAANSQNELAKSMIAANVEHYKLKNQAEQQNLERSTKSITDYAQSQGLDPEATKVFAATMGSILEGTKFEGGKNWFEVNPQQLHTEMRGKAAVAAKIALASKNANSSVWSYLFGNAKTPGDLAETPEEIKGWEGFRLALQSGQGPFSALLQRQYGYKGGNAVIPASQLGTAQEVKYGVK